MKNLSIFAQILLLGFSYSESENDLNYENSILSNGVVENNEPSKSINASLYQIPSNSSSICRSREVVSILSSLFPPITPIFGKNYTQPYADLISGSPSSKKILENRIHDFNQESKEYTAFLSADGETYVSPFDVDDWHSATLMFQPHVCMENRENWNHSSDLDSSISFLLFAIDNDCINESNEYIDALKFIFPPFSDDEDDYLDKKRVILSKFRGARSALRDVLVHFSQVQSKMEAQVEKNSEPIDFMDLKDWNDTLISTVPHPCSAALKRAVVAEMSDAPDIFSFLEKNNCIDHDNEVPQILAPKFPEIDPYEAHLYLNKPRRRFLNTSFEARKYLQKKIDYLSSQLSNASVVLHQGSLRTSEANWVTDWEKTGLHIEFKNCKDLFFYMNERKAPITYYYLDFVEKCNNASHTLLILEQIFRMNTSGDFSIPYPENFQILKYSSGVRRYVKKMISEFNEDNSHDAVVLLSMNKNGSSFVRDIDDWSQISFVGLRDLKKELTAFDHFLNSKAAQKYQISPQEATYLNSPIYCAFVRKKIAKVQGLSFIAVNRKSVIKNDSCFGSSQNITFEHVILHQNYADLKVQLREIFHWFLFNQNARAVLISTVAKLQIESTDRFYHLTNCDGDTIYGIENVSCDWKMVPDVEEIVFRWWYYNSHEPLGKNKMVSFLQKFSKASPGLVTYFGSYYNWKWYLIEFVKKVAKELNITQDFKGDLLEKIAETAQITLNDPKRYKYSCYFTNSGVTCEANYIY